MKKGISLIVLIITTVILLFVTIIIVNVSGKETTVMLENLDESRFIKTNGREAFNTEIIIDKETKVMYLWRQYSYGGGLTVMLDQDGKPLIYKDN